jgi:hypothetical protein
MQFCGFLSQFPGGSLSGKDKTGCRWNSDASFVVEFCSEVGGYDGRM